MISYSSPTPKSWSQFAEWMRGLKLDNIEIDHDYLNDTVTIRNRATMKNQRISRFALEFMPDELRQETFLQMVASTMSNPMESVQDMLVDSLESAAADAMNRATPYGSKVTQAVYTGPPMVTSGVISSGIPTVGGGGGGGAIGSYTGAPLDKFAAITRKAMGLSATEWITDEFVKIEEEQLQKDLLAKKLFSTKEQELFRSIKRHLWSTWQQQRTLEENQTWNTERMVIAGGCFASMIKGDTVQDYDVFLLDDEHNRRTAEYMATKYRDRDDIRIGGSNYMDNKQIEQTIFFKKSKFQYITTKYKTREELIEHFDFKHCRVSYDLMTEKLFITRETMDLILNKTLDPRPNFHPKPWRYEKFEERGWKRKVKKPEDDLVSIDFL